MTTFFSCGHEILDRQLLGVYSFLTIRKECDDLNEIYERQNEQTLLGIQIQLHITFLLDCNYVSFEPLSCVQLSGFTSVPVSLTLPNCPAVCIFVGRISRTFDAKYLADWQSRLQQEQLCGFLVASCR